LDAQDDNIGPAIATSNARQAGFRKIRVSDFLCMITVFLFGPSRIQSVARANGLTLNLYRGDLPIKWSSALFLVPADRR